MNQPSPAAATPSLLYPRLIKRVRAVLIDSVLIPVVTMTILIIGVSMGVSSPIAKVMLLIFPVFILEPCMLAFTRGTIGHHLVGIKVTKRNGIDKINIFAATVRFLAKLLFGWFSFVFVFTSKKHQAIHDLVAGSIVTHRDASQLPQYDILQERVVEETGYKYPAIWKRLLTIAAYCVITIVLVAMVTAFAISDACLESTRYCSGLDRLITLFVNIIFLLSFGAIIILGWKSRLYGCRRKKLT